MGKNIRDFTFIDDAVERVYSLINKIPKANKNLKKLKPDQNISKFRILNIGNSKTIKVISIIKIIEKILKTHAKKEFLPALKGDVGKTYADNKKLRKITKKKSITSYFYGIKKTISWYLDTIKK